MRLPRGKDVVAVTALVAAGGFATYLFCRSELGFGTGFSDGTERYSALAGERIRYAVWDDPEPLVGALNTPAAESRPAVSPDGRFLVFCAGERGLNADLFVAELADGVPRDPRPLARVNSPADELAPAFGPGFLVFASDRAGESFGLDLWRAPYADGVFGAPEPFGSGVNTVSDETDPRPVPGSAALAFASDRPRGMRRDFDLYLATPREAPEARGRFEVAPLAFANSPFDERDPAWTAEGRSLVFASDRQGGAGGFDLWRSFLEEGRWLAPAPLRGVNSARSERGPSPSADGFSLFFDVADEADGSGDGRAAPDLWRARSLELFRVPAPPVTWLEILLVVALVTLALLAWLAKRWGAMEVIYRCLLVSLIVHLLLLWYLRAVHPESEPVALPPGGEQLFRVRLAADAPTLASGARERDGRLEEARGAAPAQATPERLARDASAESAPATPGRATLDAPEARPADAPARADAALAERRSGAAAAVEVADREARAAPSARAAPALALATPAGTTPLPAPSAGPERAEKSAPAQPVSAPATLGLDAPAPAPAGALRAPERSALAARPADRAAAAPAPVAVAGPSERFAPAEAAAAPALALPAEARFQPESAPPAALPESAFVAARAASAEGALPLAAAPAARRLEPGDAPHPAPAARRGEAPAPAVAAAAPAVALRDEAAAPPPAESAPAPRFDATAALAPAPLARTRADDAPRRERSATRPDVPPALPAVPRTAAPERRDPAAETPTAPVALPLAPDAPATSPEVAVRAPAETPRPQAVPASAPRPAADLLAELARTDARERAPLDAAPRRFQRESAPSAVAPLPRRLVAAPPSAPPPDDAPPRVAHTPYQNRYGDQKLRALEEYGGGAETERAVARGLAYLAGIQDADGFWGSRRDFHDKYGDVRIGKTGLALLAFLGAGHTQQSRTQYSPVVARALAFLLSEQDADSGHVGDGSAYSHGIATYALAECYAITNDTALRAPLERALGQILSHQSERDDPRFRGGWGYYYKDERVWNGDTWPRTSVTAWQVMALESARLGGLEVPDAAFAEARRFLVNTWDEGRGAFRYDHDPSRLNSGYPILPASTPAALFALSLLGADVASDELAAARRFVLERAPREYRYRGDDEFVFNARGNLYFWYYGTLALFRAGGQDWQRWNVAMKETLLGAQTDDGSWQPISIYARYAGDDDEDRSYTTALCVLTLEIYYRYFTPLLSVEAR